MTYVGDYSYFVSWCIIFPTSGISAIFCMGFAYLSKAQDVCWGFLVFSVVAHYISGFRLNSAWDLPIFLRLRLFLLRRVKVSWCVIFPTSGISAIFCMGFAYPFKAATGFAKKA